MAKLSTDELLDAFKEMTLIELSQFVKQFEETFEVTAAAPVAVAAPVAAGAGRPLQFGDSAHRRQAPRRSAQAVAASHHPLSTRRKLTVEPLA